MPACQCQADAVVATTKLIAVHCFDMHRRPSAKWLTPGSAHLRQPLLPALTPPRLAFPACSRQIASYVYLASAVFLSLLCVLAVWLHFQWGASFSTFLLCLVTVLYCILGTIFLVVAVVGNDG